MTHLPLRKWKPFLLVLFQRSTPSPWIVISLEPLLLFHQGTTWPRISKVFKKIESTSIQKNDQTLISTWDERRCSVKISPRYHFEPPQMVVFRVIALGRPPTVERPDWQPKYVSCMQRRGVRSRERGGGRIRSEPGFADKAVELAEKVLDADLKDVLETVQTASSDALVTTEAALQVSTSPAICVLWPTSF